MKKLGISKKELFDLIDNIIFIYESDRTQDIEEIIKEELEDL